MIHMVISGNLTGFSHFYASPQAKSLLSEAPFDFDYRNYLTFLNGGEKAYVLSFAPRVLAMSLVTRILDSFRRPGLLTVTLLVPRGEQVVPAAGQSPDAAYRLLNELYERFMEHCFMNGMLNQNSAVLMQDYYADIVGRYALAPDGRQRAVNMAINVSTNIKRSGYVQTPENLVPLYLATPWRRGYEGFHHVFLAQHPTENLIDEQPEEVVLYRVTVSNTGQTIPAVRLTDRIPQVMPGEGEKDIASKDFTYQQVLNGEAQGIVAKLQDETIELNYRFEKEEKEIVFRFMHNGKKVKFESVMPRLRFAGDREMPLTNEKWLLLGAEINATVTVLISDPHYQVEGGTVDLRRLKHKDVCTLQLVERQMSEQRPFQAVTVRTDTATTTRTGTATTASTGTDSTTDPIARIGTDQQGGTTRNSTSQSSTSRATVTVHTGPNPEPNPRKRRQRAIISPDPTPNPRPNDFNMKVAGILGCVCVAAYLLVASFTHWWPFADSLSDAGGGELVADSAITRTVGVTFVDASGDALTPSVIKNLFENGSMKCFVAPDTAQHVVGFDSGKLAYTYELTGQQNQKFVFSVAVDGVNVCSEERSLSAIDSGLVLRLQVKASEIKLYFSKKKWIETTTPYRACKDYDTVIGEISKLKRELKDKLMRMLDEKAAETASEKKPSVEDKSNPSKPKPAQSNENPAPSKGGGNLPKDIAEAVAKKQSISIPTDLKDKTKKNILQAYNNLFNEKKIGKFNGSNVTTYSALHDSIKAARNRK